MYKSTKILLGASVLALSSGAFANSSIQNSADQQQINNLAGSYQVAANRQQAAVVKKSPGTVQGKASKKMVKTYGGSGKGIKAEKSGLAGSGKGVKAKRMQNRQ